MIKFNSKLLFLASCCLVVTFMLLISVKADDQDASAATETNTQMFKKSYVNAIERMIRQRVYMANAFQVFLAAIGYKHRKRSSYLAINHLSDRTLEEIKLMFNRKKAPAPIEPGTGTGKGVKVPINGEESTAPVVEEQTPTAAAAIPNQIDGEHLSQVLGELAREYPEQVEIGQLALELHQHNESPSIAHLRKKRDLSSSPEEGEGENGVREISVNKLIKTPESSSSSASAEPLDRVKSNNPAYEPAETTSFGLNSEENYYLPGNTPALKNLPVIDMRDRPSALGGMFRDLKNSVVGALQNHHTRFGGALGGLLSSGNDEPRLPDEVFLDHRTTEAHCYMPVRNQGTCGSCWAFATTALYEWHYCRLTQKRVAFSEQYLVDCGHVVNRHWWQELDGCNGGITSMVGEFVAKFGLELRQNYPYVFKKNDECPFNLKDSREAKKAGYIRLEKHEMKAVPFDQLARYLKRGPLVMSFHTPNNFHSYGGGVDEGEGCRENQDSHHAMLVIGHGREEGKEYWLVRNSFSYLWGETGHWKLAKRASKWCFDGDNNALRLSHVQINKDDLTSRRNIPESD